MFAEGRDQSPGDRDAHGEWQGVLPARDEGMAESEERGMTIELLITRLQYMLQTRVVEPDYTVAVWLPTHGGSEAIDIVDQFDVDGNERFVAMYPDR